MYKKERVYNINSNTNTNKLNYNKNKNITKKKKETKIKESLWVTKQMTMICRFHLNGKSYLTFRLF